MGEHASGALGLSSLVFVGLLDPLRLDEVGEDMECFLSSLLLLELLEPEDGVSEVFKESRLSCFLEIWDEV